MSDRLPCGRPKPSRGAPPNAAQLKEFQERLRSYLSSQGLKFTAPRWNIAALLLKTAGHLDAQELVAKVKEKHPNIGAATVYRSIKVLCDAGLLEATHQDMNGRILYERPYGPHHDHIICVDCGESFEFSDDQIEKLQHKVAARNDFAVAEHRHVIHGRCLYKRG